MDIHGMLDNDIISSSTGDVGQRDPHVIRLFADGVPASETPQQAATRIDVGGENESTSRQSVALRRRPPRSGLNGPRRQARTARRRPTQCNDKLRLSGR